MSTSTLGVRLTVAVGGRLTMLRPRSLGSSYSSSIVCKLLLDAADETDGLVLAMSNSSSDKLRSCVTSMVVVCKIPPIGGVLLFSSIVCAPYAPYAPYAPVPLCPLWMVVASRRGMSLLISCRQGGKFRHITVLSNSMRDQEMAGAMSQDRSAVGANFLTYLIRITLVNNELKQDD